MSQIKKIIAILTLPLIASIVISCCDCLTATVIANYSHCGLTLENLDNSGANAIVSTTNQIPKKAYGLRFSIEQIKNSCAAKTNRSFFIASTYAFSSCECPPTNEYKALDVIESIKITTLNDFDASHLKNSDISAYFFKYQGNNFIKLDDYVATLKDQSTLYDLEIPLTFDLLLMTPPANAVEHQFEVTINLSDKRVLKAKTELIKLN
jgi:hypothetical protein